MLANLNEKYPQIKEDIYINQGWPNIEWEGYQLYTSNNNMVTDFWNLEASTLEEAIKEAIKIIDSELKDSKLEIA